MLAHTIKEPALVGDTPQQGHADSEFWSVLELQLFMSSFESGNGGLKKRSQESLQ